MNWFGALLITGPALIVSVIAFVGICLGERRREAMNDAVWMRVFWWRYRRSARRDK